MGLAIWRVLDKLDLVKGFVGCSWTTRGWVGMGRMKKGFGKVARWLKMQDADN